jgi:hypothetical protein
LCESVVHYRTTVCYTGNMLGKDYWVGRLIWWWLYTRTRDPLVVVTGPSQSLLGLVTWKEARRAITRAPIPPSARITSGAKTSPQQIDLGNGVQAIGYSTTTVERASGQHSGQLLVIVEEASGVEDHVWEAIDSLGYDRLVCIGNPIRATGHFVDLIRQAEADRRDGIPPELATNAIQISSLDSPHARWEKSPVGLADRPWLESMARKYGVKSTWYRSHVLAIIPIIAAEVLIPIPWLDFLAAAVRPPVPQNHPIHLTRRISVDLGEGAGRDSSCVMVRDDDGVLDCVCGNQLGLAEAAAIVAEKKKRWKVEPNRISYDKLGIGKTFPFHLKSWGIEGALGYAGEASPSDRHSYTNLRTEAGWKARLRLDQEHVPDFHRPHREQRPFYFTPGPYLERLRDELRPLTYECHGKGIKLLKKEDWTAAIGHSPDVADSFIQSFAFA